MDNFSKFSIVRSKVTIVMVQWNTVMSQLNIMMKQWNTEISQVIIVSVQWTLQYHHEESIDKIQHCEGTMGYYDATVL